MRRWIVVLLIVGVVVLTGTASARWQGERYFWDTGGSAEDIENRTVFVQCDHHGNRIYVTEQSLVVLPGDCTQ